MRLSDAGLDEILIVFACRCNRDSRELQYINNRV